MSTPSAIPAPATGATPASNTTDETTPLLSGNADDNGINDASAAEAQEPGPSSPAAIQASILRSAVLPTWILLIASSITLILSIALFILNGFWPSGYYQGYWLDYWKPVAVSVSTRNLFPITRNIDSFSFNQKHAIYISLSDEIGLLLRLFGHRQPLFHPRLQTSRHSFQHISSPCSGIRSHQHCDDGW